jgi:hypothetical protein
VLARRPNDAELNVLLGGYAEHLRDFRRDPVAAKRLLKQGDSPVDPSLDRAELAAMSSVASVILNLDEAVTKE